MRVYKTILSSILFFLIFFGIKFSFFPVGFSKLLLFLLFGYYLTHTSVKKVKVALPGKIFYALIILVVLFLYSIFITIFNGVNDFQYVTKLLFIMYEPILGGFLVSYFVVNYLKFNFEEVLEAIANAIFLQAVLTVCAYLSPGVNDLFNALLPNAGNIDNNQDTRVRGFTNLGGAWLSVILTIAVVLNLYFFGYCKLWWKRLILLFKVLICLGATFVTGRTGFLLSLFSVAVFCGYWMFIQYRPRNVLRFFLPIVLISVLIYFYFPSIDSFVNQDTINWALEIFLNSDSMSTSSSDDLKSMLYLPSNVYHLIFGVGFYETGVMFYPRSDSGYVKTILSVGLLGATLYYSIFVFYFGIILNYLSRFYGGKEYLLFLFLFIIFLIVEVKEPYLQTIGVTNFIFFWFFYLNNKANCHEQS